MMRRLVLFLLLATACNPPLRQRAVLAIGDGNGAAAQGWVSQFQRLRGGGPLVNTATGGNTIGFNNSGRTDLNTLENLTNYLRRGYAEMGGIDEIIIGLGTNDCKAQFSDRQGNIDDNLNTLLDRIEKFFTERGQEQPRIVLLTPPPIGEDKVVGEFAGGRECVASFSREIVSIGIQRGLCVVDLQDTPRDGALTYSDDGIHFSEEGYRMIARAILQECY